MAMPTYVGAWEYRNNAGTPVDLSGADIILEVTYTNFSGATTVGMSVYLEDSLGANHETDQTWADESVPSTATFEIADYESQLDVSDVVFMRVGVGVDGGYYENLYFNIYTGEPGAGGGGGEG